MGIGCICYIPLDLESVLVILVQANCCSSTCSSMVRAICRPSCLRCLTLPQWGSCLFSRLAWLRLPGKIPASRAPPLSLGGPKCSPGECQLSLWGHNPLGTLPAGPNLLSPEDSKPLQTLAPARIARMPEVTVSFEPNSDLRNQTQLESIVMAMHSKPACGCHFEAAS